MFLLDLMNVPTWSKDVPNLIVLMGNYFYAICFIQINYEQNKSLKYNLQREK